MATVVLAAAVKSAIVAGGAAATGAAVTFGTAAATIVGAYIDQTFILPRFLDKNDGAAFGDVSIQQSQEGAPYQYGVGPECRVPGFVAWQRRQLIVVEEEVGKGGPTQTQFNYFTHATWSFGRAPSGGAKDIQILWFDGKRIFNKLNEDVRLLGHLYEVIDEPLYITLIGSAYIYGHHMKIQSTTPSMPDLSLFTVGVNIQISRMSNSNNDGTFRVLARGVNIDGTTWIRVRNDNVVDSGGLPAAGSSGTPAIFWQNLPQFTPGLADALIVKKGTYNQTPIALIEEEQGAGNVPNFHGFVTATLQRLALFDFGNRLPNAEALVKFTDELTVANTITFLLTEYCKIPANLIDVTGITSTETVRGYWWTAPFDGVSLLQPLLIAYDIIVNEVDGMLVFQDRATLSSVEIENRHLGARQAGDPIRIAEAEVLDGSQVKIPGRVQVKYIDPESDYQRGSQQVRRPDLPDGEYVSFEFPLVLTRQQAKKIATRLLWLPEFNRQELTFSIPPRYMNVTEGTIVEFTAHGKLWRVLVLSVARGDDYRLECRGIVEDAVVYDLPALDTELGGASTNISDAYYPPDLTFEVLDIPPLSNADAMTMGYYLVAAALSPDAEWFGGNYYARYSTVATHSQLETIASEGFIGRCLTMLGEGEPGYFNEGGYLDVEMYNGGLSSLSEDLVYRGFNMALVGSEIIQFATAVLHPTSTNPNVWRISKFIRGLKDTWPAIGDHVAGERFVLLRPNALRRVETSQGDVGRTRYHKAVPLQGIEDDFIEVEHTVEGRNGVTWTPAHIHSFPFGDDLIITWNRRVRLVMPIFNDGAEPSEESQSLWRIIIYSKLTSTVRRTIDNINQSRYTYTRQQQIDDGNFGFSFNMSIRQVGTIGGRGNEHIVTLPIYP